MKEDDFKKEMEKIQQEIERLKRNFKMTPKVKIFINNKEKYSSHKNEGKIYKSNISQS
jgi:hypothetical protein